MSPARFMAVSAPRAGPSHGDERRASGRAVDEQDRVAGQQPRDLPAVVQRGVAEVVVQVAAVEEYAVGCALPLDGEAGAGEGAWPRGEPPEQVQHVVEAVEQQDVAVRDAAAARDRAHLGPEPVGNEPLHNT